MSSKSKSKNGIAPKLRFPEFGNADGWDKKKLSDLLFETKKRNKELRYSANNVLSVSGEFGCVNQIALLGRSYAGVSVANYHIVETGDIVYTKSPLKKNPYGIIKENKGKIGIVSTLYAVYRPTELAVSTYLDHYFSRDYNLNSYLQPIVRKGAKNDMKVNNTAVLGGEIWVPKIGEQQRIADCLSSLDELIEAEDGKLETLQQHKKGLMQELFPAEGKNLPKRRFPEFRDSPAWEEKPLGNLLLSPPEYGVNAPAVPFSEKLPAYLRITDISEDGRFLIEKKASVALEATDKQYLIDGDIVLARTGASVGKSYKYRNEDGRLVFAGFLIRVRPNPAKVNSTFLFNFLFTKRYWKWVSITSARSGQPGINGSEYASLTIPISTLNEEQKRIAEFLSSIDDLITTQIQKLDALRDHKKGLMQQLFPAASEAQE